MKVLHINSSVLGEGSHSQALAQEFITHLESGQQINLTQRNLAQQPIGDISADHLAAFSAENPTPEQAALNQQSLNLINEIKQADVLLIGLPMYNFTVPSQFKQWMDQVARAGVSFQYTANGAEGLLENKPVYVLASRGGFYAGTENDTQTPLIKQFFAMLGITNVHFIYAEGLNISPEQQQQSLAEARKKLANISQQLTTAAA